MLAVCLKWVDRRPEVDPLTGEVDTDARTSGASDADLAALELALRWGDGEVVAVTAGPPEAEAMLREALAAGAARAVRVDVPAELPSEAVTAALAPVVRGCAAVLCGDWSLDRGSGAVPAFLAAHLGAAQALGLVSFDVEADGAVVAERRLDGGRRERLRVRPPMVLSVEGSVPLRRAPIDAVLAAKEAAIEVVRPVRALPSPPPAEIGPYRPRPRVLPAPPSDLSARERVLALTGALVDRTPPERVVLDPPAAAERILEQLRAWGYLPSTP